MADNKAQLVVDGDVSPLRQKLREAARDLKQFGDEGKSSVEGLGGPLKALQDKFVAIGAILAGGAVFKAAVAATAEWAQESVDLAAALGMSATAASDLKAALASENVSVDQFVTAGQKLAATLRTDEESLKAVGLSTRDAAGNLRPLNELTLDAIGLVGQYKAGTDRAVAANVLFGKGFQINGDLAKVNSALVAEYTEKQRALGVTLSEDNVAAFEAYEESGKNTALMLRGLQQTIGNALMPVLTKLANWFTAIGPAAVVVLKGAIGGLVAAFWALKNGVTVVWEVINAMVVSVAEPLRALASALFKIAQGDFKGAWGEFQSAGETMANAWKGALSEMEASSQETRDKIWALFAEGAPAAAPGQEGLSADGLIKEPKEAGGKAGKDAADKALADRIKAEEDAYKEAVKIAEDYEAQWDREYKAVADAAKKSAKDRMDVEMARAEGVRNLEMLRLDELEAQAQHERDLSTISQQEYLDRMAKFNAARLQAEVDLIAAKIEAAKADPTTSPAELERLEMQLAEVRARYALQAADLVRKQAQDTETIWSQLGDRISGLWDKGIQSLMNGTLTWKNAMQAVLAEVVGVFGNASKKMVGDWLAGETRKLGMKMGFISQEKALDAAAASATVASKTAETTEVVGANAAQAASGAASSQASIPYVGPVLAIAAMAAMFAAVSAMGKRKSAMGGYDIPKGVNPMTQLHEEEMVLPKQYANAIRNLTAQGEGGAAGGGAGTRIVNVIDPALAADYVQSSAGEKVILNHIRANAGAVKSMLS